MAKNKLMDTGTFSKHYVEYEIKMVLFMVVCDNWSVWRYNFGTNPINT